MVEGDDRPVRRGVVTGTVLSFELGLLWPNFMARFGDVFGVAFAAEGFSSCVSLTAKTPCAATAQQAQKRDSRKEEVSMTTELVLLGTAGTLARRRPRGDLVSAHRRRTSLRDRARPGNHIPVSARMKGRIQRAADRAAPGLSSGLGPWAGYPGCSTALITPSARRSKRWYRSGASWRRPWWVTIWPGRARPETTRSRSRVV